MKKNSSSLDELNKDLTQTNITVSHALAELTVIGVADELLAKGSLTTSKEKYIEEHLPIIEQELSKHFKKKEDRFKLAGNIIKNELLLLPQTQKEGYEKNLVQGLTLFGQLQTNQSLIKDKLNLLTANTYQDFFGLTNETMLWIYSIGHKLLENKQTEEAYAIFQMLVTFNSLVSDYWIALGFAQRLSKEDSEALNSFAMATLLNPENPITRYNSAEIYFDMKQYDDALLELDALSEIIKKYQLNDLNPSVTALKKQIMLYNQK